MPTCEDLLAACQKRRDDALRMRDVWKERAEAAESCITLPGRYRRYPTRVERWRGMVKYYADQYAMQYLGRVATSWEIDMLLGIIYGESGGNPNAICRVEWIGDPPPGYDPADPLTRASGLFQHVPRYYYGGRAKAAGFEGRNIMDVEANIGTACWLVYHSPSRAPNWRHWPDAPTGALGSASKAKARLAPLYDG